MLAVKVNGISLAYERRGKGRPLVLLHGYPLDHSTMKTLVPLLEHDFDLILPDLRGFGESQAVRTGFTMADCAVDVAGLLDHLNIKKTAIAGHSMGGYVALAFVSAYPERVLGLGLVSSQALADTPERKAGRNQEADAILTNGVREVAESMPGKLTAKPDLQGWLRELILRQRPEGLAGALRAMAERPDSTPLLAGFDHPIVLVHGMADALIPIERARSVKAAVPDAYMTEIPDAGHMTMMEAPQKTADALRALL
ncbi:MAG: alpha/beta hydrolase [Anaerolineales bacterium]|jgi:pimeloyl-ACP methyl ester carboxylesterase